MIKRNCIKCGKEFRTYASKHNNKYCSVKCRGLGQRNKIKKICPTCGREFTTYPSDIKRGGGKFCSHKCQTKKRWNIKRVSCKTCRKSFIRNISQLKDGKGKYCSKKCFNKDRRLRYKDPNWKGGKKKNSTGYVLVFRPDHPFPNISGYVREHRIVYEDWLKEHDPNSPYLVKVKGFEGKWLDPKTIIHHKNKIRDDNRILNLKLFANNGFHSKFHHSLITPL